MYPIGFMQGRLSPLVNDKIQAFPWKTWRDEFFYAQEIDMQIMEWTLDQDRLYDNPLMTKTGQDEILKLSNDHRLSIPSLTGDCFMQAPLWKSKNKKREILEQDFINVIQSSSSVGIGSVILPLVDNGRLENLKQEDDLISFLFSLENFFIAQKIKVIFELDYKPKNVARFIDRLNPSIFGINYDIGNSSSLGYDPDEEFNEYGKRILNVHVKDRLLGGSTVPLGSGSAQFNKIFFLLSKFNYKGNYILQTARSQNSMHIEAIQHYRNLVMSWIKTHAY